MKRVAMVGLGLLLAGCATIPMVPTTAALGQSTSQQNADETACAAATQGQESRDRLYGACMIDRGYEMYVRLVGIHAIRVKQAGSGGSRPVPVLNALQGCDRSVAGLVETDAERGKRLKNEMLLSLVSPYLMDMRVFSISDYTNCMTAQGYAARPWTPR